MLAMLRQERIVMNTLTKWDPFKSWDPFRELDDFSNRLGSFFGRAPAQRETENYGWSPAVDIIEDDKMNTRDFVQARTHFARSCAPR